MSGKRRPALLSGRGHMDEATRLRNLTTDELLRHVDTSNPQVKELVSRLEIYFDEDPEKENRISQCGTSAGVS